MAGASGDALHAALVEHVGVASLLLGHGLDHGLDPAELLVVEGFGRQLLQELSHAWQLLEDGPEVAHLLDHPDLLEEVVEGELPLQHLYGVLLGRVLIDDLLEVLHQAHDVAEAEDAVGQTLGPEFLELVEAFAHADVLDGLAGHLLDAERRATAGVAVELGEDEAGEVEAAVELGGCLDGVLADHRVADEEDVLGLGLGLDLLELTHEGVVEGEAASGVEDDHVAAHVAGLLHGEGTELYGLHALDAEDGHGQLSAEGHELVDGGRSVDVSGDQHGLVALGQQLLGELAGGGGLARALEAHHHDERGLSFHREAGFHGAHEPHQLVMADLDEVIGRGDLGASGQTMAPFLARERDHLAHGPLADRGQELFHHAQLDVGLEQAHADVSERTLDVVFVEAGLALQLEAGGAEALGEGLEHGGASLEAVGFGTGFAFLDLWRAQPGRIQVRSGSRRRAVAQAAVSSSPRARSALARPP